MEKLNGNSVLVKAPAAPLETFEERLTHQSCPELGRENSELLYPHVGSVGYPGSRSGLEQGSCLQQGQSLKGDDNIKWNSHCVIKLLTCFF